MPTTGYVIVLALGHKSGDGGGGQGGRRGRGGGCVF